MSKSLETIYDVSLFIVKLLSNFRPVMILKNSMLVVATVCNSIGYIAVAGRRVTATVA